MRLKSKTKMLTNIIPSIMTFGSLTLAKTMDVEKCLPAAQRLVKSQ
jgi:hypothetical protein